MFYIIQTDIVVSPVITQIYRNDLARHFRSDHLLANVRRRSYSLLLRKPQVHELIQLLDFVGKSDR